MKAAIKSAIDYFSGEPKKLFLLDGLGGAFTTCSLFFVVSNYTEYFGMSANIATYLSAIGLVYCTYSMLCYFLLSGNWTPYLRIIATGNFLYCILTMAFLYTYYKNLTRIGLTYFLGEMLIIALLAYIELCVAQDLRARKTH
jgi:hypothetical protein